MKLHIPVQIKPTGEAFVCQPDQFKRWLADLPQTNMGELTRNVYSALCEHNKQTMPDADRFENLEMLRKPIRTILNNLKKHFTHFEIEHIEREKNSEADRLARKGSKLKGRKLEKQEDE